jgi:hypothetical protein
MRPHKQLWLFFYYVWFLLNPQVKQTEINVHFLFEYPTHSFLLTRTGEQKLIKKKPNH